MIGVFEQEVLNKGIAIGKAIGKAEGKAIGKAEGKAIGKAEGIIEDINIILKYRFNDEQHIRNLKKKLKSIANIKQLHDIFRISLEVKSLNEFIKKTNLN
jgi:predicted transposase YdaD